MIQLKLFGEVIGSARTTLPVAAHTRMPRARGFKADIANLLFEPKKIAVMTIPTATPPFNPHPRSEAGMEIDRLGEWAPHCVES